MEGDAERRGWLTLELLTIILCIACSYFVVLQVKTKIYNVALSWELLYWAARDVPFFRVYFFSENPKPCQKFAINSQTEYNFYDDFLKFWKVLRIIVLCKLS